MIVDEVPVEDDDGWSGMTRGPGRDTWWLGWRTMVEGSRVKGGGVDGER